MGFGIRSGRDIDKFTKTSYKKNVTGCPLVQDHTLAVLEAKAEQQLDIGAHTIFAGELLSAEKIRDGVAITYEYYHNVIRGKSPKNAPTYFKEIHGDKS